MEMTVEEILIMMKQFFENIDKEIKELQEELRQKELEQQDILHYIENNNLNAGGYSKAGKLLKKIRIERRLIKNDIDRVTILKSFTDKYNNKMINGDILRTLKELGKLNKKQQKPIYVRRTNIIENLEDKTKEQKNSDQDSIIMQEQEKQSTDSME